jgi:type I restriction enzyme M protein
MAGTTNKANGKRLATQQSVNAAVKSICNIMRRSNCAGALQYVPELTWILFLRILDERETREAEEAEAVGAEFTASLDAPYRWRDWAAPRAVPSDLSCRTALWALSSASLTAI